MSIRVAKRFLRRVWAAQPQHPDSYVFLSVKDWDDGSWEDCPIPHVEDGNLTIPTLEDLYFAPCIFKTDRRRKAHALPGRWLYADLDEVDPRGLRIEPTIAWETSPGRYQALWQLKRPLRPEQLELLNQKLTYYTGADKGGWSLTKVLRVPGSNSNKRDTTYLVQNLWTEGPVHSASAIYDKIKSTDTPRTVAAKLPPLKLPKASRSKIYRRARPKLGVTARRLLEASEATRGTRSERLWKLERLLIEAGLPAEHVFVLVKGSVWNKYRGQQREDEQLWREINQASVTNSPSSSTKDGTDTSSTKQRNETESARAKRGRKSQQQEEIGSSSSTDETRLLPVALSDFVGKRIRKPMWMVEDIWSESAHGLIAGMPKTYKSVLATDLAISVASGTKFLDRFEVPQTGPVVMIQKENTEGDVQDRVLRILDSRGLGEHAELNGAGIKYRPAADLPLHFINNPDIDLADQDDMQRIADLVRDIRPVLLILDPLYLLAPSVDENSAHAMTPILAALLKIKVNYNCGTLLIHHYNKPKEDSPARGAVRVSGTGAFHRWFESAMLLERDDYEEPVIKISTEHRGQTPTPAFEVRIDLGTHEDLHYGIDIRPVGKARKKQDQAAIEELFETRQKMTLKSVADALEISVRAAERRAEEAGLKVVQGKVSGKTQRIVKKEDG